MKNFHIKEVPTGGYDVMYNSITIDHRSTKKEARKVMAEKKRNLKYSNLVHKFQVFGRALNS